MSSYRMGQIRLASRNDDPLLAPLPSRRSCYRRRPPCSFVLAWAGLTFLLANVFLLRIPSQPTSSRFIGYQAFESIPDGKALLNAVQNTATTDAPSNAPDGPSFPLDIYAPLLPNPAPITELDVISCVSLPFVPCFPPSTREQDNVLGKWVKVDRPLDSDMARTAGVPQSGPGIIASLFGSLESRYIFYRKSRRDDAPRLVDVKLVGDFTGLAPSRDDGWHRIDSDLRNSWTRLFGEKGNLRLWYRLLRPGQPMEGLEPITELDIVYGPNPAWPGFELMGEISAENQQMRHSSVHLAARRKPDVPSAPVHPTFKADGTFKILQLADLHLSVNHEPCRDVGWESKEKPCVSDTDTLKMIERWLDEEKPDMVVLTGDQLNGQGTSWDEKSVLAKLYKPIIDRKIPHAAIPGNHDSQAGVLTRTQQWAAISRLPYTLTRVGPANLHDGSGAGNFYVHLVSPTPDATHLFTLYFLDSGTSRPRGPWTKTPPWKETKGYDWVREDQRKWFLSQSKEVKPVVRPYNPDGGKDLPKQSWGEQAPGAQSPARPAMGVKLPDEKGAGEPSMAILPVVKGSAAHQPPSSRQAPPVPAQSKSDPKVWDANTLPPGARLEKPRAALFVHIPLPDAFSPVDRDETGKEMIVSGQRGENDIIGAQGEQGLFEDIMLQKDQRDVEIVVSGHMHLNTDCRHAGLWMCFGGGSSLAGYGSKTLPRMTRILQLSKWGEEVSTWHRLENGTKVDEAWLLGDKAMKSGRARKEL